MEESSNLFYGGVTEFVEWQIPGRAHNKVRKISKMESGESSVG
jgi:hypothetical protein